MQINAGPMCWSVAGIHAHTADTDSSLASRVQQLISPHLIACPQMHGNTLTLHPYLLPLDTDPHGSDPCWLTGTL